MDAFSIVHTKKASAAGPKNMPSIADRSTSKTPVGAPNGDTPTAAKAKPIQKELQAGHSSNSANLPVARLQNQRMIVERATNQWMQAHKITNKASCCRCSTVIAT